MNAVPSAGAPGTAGANQARLLSALKEVQRAWLAAGERWNDAARADFGRDFVEPLEPLVLAALRGLEQMDELRARALKEG